MSNGLSLSSGALPSLNAFSRLSSVMFTLQMFLHNPITFLISPSFKHIVHVKRNSLNSEGSSHIKSIIPLWWETLKYVILSFLSHLT